MTDPLLKEFLIFFGVWPLVIVLTIMIGMKLGKLLSRNVERGTLKPVAVRTADTARRRL